MSASLTRSLAARSLGLRGLLLFGLSDIHTAKFVQVSVAFSFEHEESYLEHQVPWPEHVVELSRNT